MINSNYFINSSQKDTIKKPESDKFSSNIKDNNYKESWNRDVENGHIMKTDNEVNLRDANKDFNNMLNHQRDKMYNSNENTSRELDNSNLKHLNLDNKSEISNVKNSIEKVAEIISNDENFQGNKIDEEALEEIVALLNQIINSLEIKSLMPVKLEDPMQISNRYTTKTSDEFIGINSRNVQAIINIKTVGAKNINTENINKDNVLDILNDMQLGIDSDPIGNSEIINVLNKENNLDVNLKVLRSVNSSNEALNLTNTILEILNSQNVEGVLSEKDVDGIKNVLDGLVEKIFESDIGLTNNGEDVQEINNINGQEVISNNFKLSEKINSHDKLKITNKEIETTNEINEVRNVFKEVDDNLKVIKNTLMNSMSSEKKEDALLKNLIVNDSDKIIVESLKNINEIKDGLNSLNEIQEILSLESFNGILGSEEIAGVVVSKNVEDILSSKEIDGKISTKNIEEFIISKDVNEPNNDFKVLVENEIKSNTSSINNQLDAVNKDISLSTVDEIKSMITKLKLEFNDSGNTITKSSVLSELESVLKTTQLDLNSNEMKKTLIDLKVVVKSLINSGNVLLDDMESANPQNILSKLDYNLDSTLDTSAKISDGNTSISIDKASEVNPFEEEDKVLLKILGDSENLGTGISKQGILTTRLDIKAPDIIKEPMVVNKETMDVDIIKNVKFMMKNQVSELKVKIYPKELGEMTIKLLSEEGILKAEIKAVSKETYNLLNSNLNDIKKSLEQQNIKIHEVNIGLYNNDTTYHSGEKSNEEMFKNNENNRNRQGKDSSNSSGFINDEFEEEKNVYEDSSVNLLV